MGFKNVQRSNRTFASLSKGFIVIRTVKDDSFGEFEAEARELTKGKNAGDTIYEFHFPAYEGHITDVRIKDDGDYGDQMLIDLEDRSAERGARYSKITIQIPMDNSNAVKFIRYLGNLNIKNKVSFEPQAWIDKKTGKDKTGLKLIQDDEELEYAIEWEDMPEVKVNKKKGGKTEYDSTELLEYLYPVFEKWRKKNKMGEFKPSSDEEAEEETPKRSGFKNVSSNDKGKEVTKKKPRDDEDEDDDDDEEEEEKPKASAKKEKEKPKRTPVDDEDEDDIEY